MYLDIPDTKCIHLYDLYAVTYSEQLCGYMPSKCLHEMRRLKDEYRFPKHPTFQKNPREEFV